MPLVIENERGVPLALPSVAARLRDIDASYELRAYRLGDSGIQWAVTCPWPQGNRKWARVQCGELSPAQAFDIIAWIPLDVSVDDVPGYVERGLVGLGSGDDHIRRALAKIRTENEKAPEERWAKVIDRAMESFETHSALASPDVIRIASAGIPNAPSKGRRKRA